MCKFLQIHSAQTKQDIIYDKYFIQAEKCWHKYLHLLTDDFNSYINTDFKSFINSLSPYFWIILNSNNEFMGIVYLDNFTGNRNQLYCAEISVCFARRGWGTFVRYCSKFFLKMCFDRFGFHKIKAQIYPQNHYVKRILKDCGFEYEATLIKETLKNGKPQDLEIYSLYRNYYYKTTG